ncbi:hypothetical protein EST38_g10397 [Candolleomyces aberdarensis]|uniref:Uncharacterized protein n=1 Tax=Candolleomyces aberdarensis TaxID=2316362 RepID=A0A4Q2D9N9_9AGAR|nr:hypothetical protein EST38_g10397 [Candolleomyces aberdarensis]
MHLTGPELARNDYVSRRLKSRSRPNYDMPLKRSLEDVDELIQDVPLPGNWIDTLVETPDLAVLLAHIAQKAGITDRQIKRSRYTLPSFSRATWEDVSVKHGLPSSPQLLDYEETVSPPA